MPDYQQHERFGVHYLRPTSLFPRVGFIVTNMTAGPEGVVRFYNGRGTAEQWIKEGAPRSA